MEVILILLIAVIILQVWILAVRYKVLSNFFQKSHHTNNELFMNLENESSGLDIDNTATLNSYPVPILSTEYGGDDFIQTELSKIICDDLGIAVIIFQKNEVKYLNQIFADLFDYKIC